MKSLFDIASQDPPQKNKPLLLVKRDQRHTPAEHSVWDCSASQPSALVRQDQALDTDSKGGLSFLSTTGLINLCKLHFTWRVKVYAETVWKGGKEGGEKLR